MLHIAIYCDRSENTVETLRNILQDYLIEASLMAKVSVFTDPQVFITTPNSFDIYVMDLDSGDYVLHLTEDMRKIDNGAHFVFIGSRPEDAMKAIKMKIDYFVLKPIDKEEFIEVMQSIKEQIQDDNIVIRTALGEKRVRINNLNYINIVKRCLCYHMKDGNMFDGQTLRTSFEKTITPLQYHKAFLFITPSTLVNIGAIEEVNSDHIVFENGEKMYFPKTQHDKVMSEWKNYTRVLEIDDHTKRPGTPEEFVKKYDYDSKITKN